MTESVSEMVADGVKVELAIIVIPNIMSVPGVDLVGPLPPELNSYVTFTAGVFGAVAEPTGRARAHQIAQEPGRCCCDQGQRHGAKMKMTALSSWQFWAVLSAIFAALTKAIFAKSRGGEYQLRPRHFHPHHCRHRYAGISAGGDRAVSDAGDNSAAHLSVPAAVGTGYWRVMAVLFPRAENRPGGAGGANRQSSAWS